MNRTMLITNLAPSVTENELKLIFAPFGVRSVRVFRNPTGRSQGQAALSIRALDSDLENDAMSRHARAQGLIVSEWTRSKKAGRSLEPRRTRRELY